MAIEQAVCTQFKTALLQGVYNFQNGLACNCALYTADANLNAETLGYGRDGIGAHELVDNTYTAGGNAIVLRMQRSDDLIEITASDVSFPNLNGAFGGCLIYAPAITNDQGDNGGAIAVFNFGNVVSAGDFDIRFSARPLMVIG